MSVREAVVITLNLETTVALTNGYSIFLFLFYQHSANGFNLLQRCLQIRANCRGGREITAIEETGRGAIPDNLLQPAETGNGFQRRKSSAVFVPTNYTRICTRFFLSSEEREKSFLQKQHRSIASRSRVNSRDCTGVPILCNGDNCEAGATALICI
jgi:hypothetical protein